MSRSHRNSRSIIYQQQLKEAESLSHQFNATPHKTGNLYESNLQQWKLNEGLHKNILKLTREISQVTQEAETNTNLLSSCKMEMQHLQGTSIGTTGLNTPSLTFEPPGISSVATPRRKAFKRRRTEPSTEEKTNNSCPNEE